MDLTDIYCALRDLDVTANRTSFFYAAYAIHLVEENPDLTVFLRRDLYPLVAEQYKTDRETVEKGLLSVIRIAWKHRPDLLERMAGTPLSKRPAPAQFLTILSGYVREVRKLPPRLRREAAEEQASNATQA